MIRRIAFVSAAVVFIPLAAWGIVSAAEEAHDWLAEQRTGTADSFQSGESSAHDTRNPRERVAEEFEALRAQGWTILYGRDGKPFHASAPVAEEEK